MAMVVHSDSAVLSTQLFPNVSYETQINGGQLLKDKDGS